MQIVIDIHEKDYQAALRGHITFAVLDAIQNGTVLKTASWEKFGKGNSWVCSNCRRGVTSREKYCPECGSLMNRG